MNSEILIPVDDFPVLTNEVDGQRIIYMDSAATALKPKCVIDKICDYYTYNSSNIHRGKHRLSDSASNDYEATRLTVANYFGVQANEIVFTSNATHALNLVANGLCLAPDDLVLASQDSHHSQILPWRNSAKVELIRVLANGRLDLEHFQALLKRQPAVVALTHCSNVTGVIHPIEEMVSMIREQTDAIIVLDAAQSAPHQRLQLKALKVDFVAISGHKMLCPSGIGFLYGPVDQLERLKPQQHGGGTVDWVDEQSHVLRRAPYHLEAGTPAIASVIGARAAFDYLMRIDEKLRATHDVQLAEAMVSGARQRPYLQLIGPDSTEARIATVSLKIVGAHSVGEFARLLSDSFGVMCRSGYMCSQPFVANIAGGEVLRASAYLYNTVTHVRQFYQAMDELAACMGLVDLNEIAAD
ncbi:aminotransferase class V-fold PLP-dependent enzyme [Vibrio coralliilyticus]|uniref:aminotransferase class V-fold PLP-dependent enzyme n=1 Tax=Vibrio coralliilyticus TaxID=190893 RepID=UPI00051274D1|nr:aminotransferase class V-fold PLP-dependent enzyme [Vibrio coralliilyticus]AIS58329.1 cysteine desulfurase [Vibrio coralliilyticus]